MTGEIFGKLSDFLYHQGWKKVNSALDGKVCHFTKYDCDRLIEIVDESIPGGSRTLKSAVEILAEVEKRDFDSLSDLFFSKDPVLQMKYPRTEIALSASNGLVITEIDSTFFSFVKNLSSNLRTNEKEKSVIASGIITSLGWDNEDEGRNCIHRSNGQYFVL